jgi:hypothetical protein
MLKSITLLGERRVFRSPSGQKPIPAEVIVGLEQQDGTQWLMRTGDPRYPYPRTIEPRRVPVVLGQTALSRLTSIYQRVFVDGEQIDYDCTSLPMYLYGKTDDLLRGPFPGFGHNSKFPARPNDLEAGRPYKVIDALDRGVHTMIALGGMHSLSLTGKSVDGGGLLMRAANQHMMTAYGGVRIEEMVGQGNIRFEFD